MDDFTCENSMQQVRTLVSGESMENFPLNPKIKSLRKKEAWLTFTGMKVHTKLCRAGAWGGKGLQTDRTAATGKREMASRPPAAGGALGSTNLAVKGRLGPAGQNT